MRDFVGKTAVITGGGTGIGAAIAHELARRGARVVLTSRKRERLDEVARQLHEQLRPLALGHVNVVGDVDHPRQLRC